MILVAGGQLDPNIGALLRRILQREVEFRALLVGPTLTPRIEIDFEAGSFALDGEVLSPSALFLRHDVFLPQRTGLPRHQAAALNWHHAVRGWFAGQQSVRCFNRETYAQENNKVRNLLLARSAGLCVPRTWISNSDRPEGVGAEPHIQKPVAGGELTTLLSEASEERRGTPRFVQPRLSRPEARIFRVGPRLLAFHIESAELDYRGAKDVSIRPVRVEPRVTEPLLALCDALALDFAAADFMLGRAGESVFLEVNSQPMFAAFDRAVDGELCDAILDHLAPRATQATEGPNVRPSCPYGPQPNVVKNEAR